MSVETFLATGNSETSSSSVVEEIDKDENNTYTIDDRVTDEANATDKAALKVNKRQDIEKKRNNRVCCGK